MFVGATAVFLASPVRQLWDSNYTVLLSEALYRHGSFALDRYFAAGAPPSSINRAGGHLYYSFPPGSSVLSIPLVAVLNAAGLSGIGPDGRPDFLGEESAQALIAAVLMGVFTTVVFLTSRLLLPRGPSLLVAAVTALGTQVWSTASRGLWSDTWCLVLLGVFIHLLVRAETSHAGLRAVPMASLAAWMYFVRPLSAVAVAAVTVYLLFRRRVRVAAYLLAGVAWLAGFIAYSLSLYGDWLPPYYQPARLSGDGPWTALLGTLVSPSRGLFVCVPAALVAAYLLVRYRRFVPHRSLAWLAAAGAAGHVAVLAFFPHWWGGSGYGSRLTTGVVPWLALMATLGMAARSRWRQQATGARRLENGLLAAAIVASMAIQARGALSRETWLWNERPVVVDQDPRRVWDWGYPQWLAGLVTPPLREGLPRWTVGETLFPGRESARLFLWEGWSWPEDGFRWTDGPRAEVRFALPAPPGPVLLRLRARPFLLPGQIEEQRVDVELNGQSVAALRLRSPAEPAMVLPAASLGDLNRLRLMLPDAERARRGAVEPRRLGIAVEWMRLEPFPALPADGTIDAGRPDGARFFGPGWDSPEPAFDQRGRALRWTLGRASEVWFAVDGSGGRILRLHARPLVVPALWPAQRVSLSLNGRHLASRTLTEPVPDWWTLAVAGDRLEEANVLRLELKDAVFPRRLGIGVDDRALALAVHTLQLVPFAPFPKGRLAMASPSSEPYLGDGWGPPRAGGRTMVADRAEVLFSRSAHGAGWLRIRARPGAFVAGQGRLLVELNGEPLGRLESGAEAPAMFALRAEDARAENILALTAETPGARPLVEWIDLDPLPATAR